MSYENPGSLFAGTHETYLRYRVAHPGLFVDLVDLLAPPGPVLDLGCGPGSVALALAARGRRVLAVDASADMVGFGRAEAARHGVGHLVESACADVHRLGDVGAFAAATMGDAFHWFDRVEILTHMDALVVHGGLVAVIMSYFAGTPKPWWHPLTERVVDRHLGPARLAGPEAPVFAASPGGDHEAVLRASAFCDLCVLRADQRVRMDLEEAVGHQYTQAFSSPALLGDRLGAFNADLRR
ncbi:MAG: hypothetical protein QG622_3184 [Actinomycetota bacterium]|nr:hypothetical protein [Actinomycetota bacterium]